MEVDRAAKIARYWPIVADGINYAPISLQVALTDSCFNRCIGCGHPSRVQKKMDVNEYLDRLMRVPGVESVCYSGGDPMAYHDFNKVMSYHINDDLAFGMTITGYVPPTIDMQLMRRAQFVRVSLDAIDPVLYEKVRGKTPLSKVLACVDDMLAIGIKVGLGITITPDNEHHYKEVIAWGQYRGITDIDARLAYPESNVKWTSNTKADRRVMPFQTCNAVFYQLYIDSDGSVYPCCITAGDTRSAPQALALGNLFTEHWALDIWPRVIKYSRVKYENLPEICRTSCVKRLSEINALTGRMPLTQSFF